MRSPSFSAIPISRHGYVRAPPCDRDVISGLGDLQITVGVEVSCKGYGGWVAARPLPPVPFSHSPE